MYFTKKDVLWKWKNDQQQTFDLLKKSFITAPILRILNDTNLYWLFTNASDFAISSVLSQFNSNDGLYHSVAFHFKSLNVYKWNYEIYYKKMLAIIRELEEYRHYLEGHSEKFKI